MLNKHIEEQTDKIAFILMNEILSNENAVYDGFKVLKNKIREFILNDQPITMLLPAFPCKSINLDKVLGSQPDMGEYLVLRKFAGVLRNIEAIYEHGAKLAIFSDYHTFSDYISVDLNDHYQYAEQLQLLVESLNCQEIIEIVNFHHYPEFIDFEEKDYLQQLRLQFGDKQFEQDFPQLIKSNEKLNDTYLGLKKFMRQDQHYLIASLNNRGKKRRLSEIAQGMIIQGKALDNFLTQKFPDHLRLSIHSHPMDGRKYALYLFNEEQYKTPWHNSVLFDATSDEFITEPQKVHYSSLLDNEIILPVTLRDQPWMLVKLSISNSHMIDEVKQVEFSLLREKSALIIKTQTPLPADIFETDEITALLKHFGVVIFKGFTSFKEPEDLEKWYGTRGPLLPWKFGYTHIVTPQHKGQDKPVSAVDSKEGLPMHWDLISPPSYMNIDQKQYEYKDFIPREFCLYCHTNHPTDPKTDGLSLLVDASLVPLTISGQEREQLRQTTLAYSTKATYFGGVDKEYPLIMNCDWTGEDILRWWEVWHEDNHPGTLQPNYSTIVQSDHYQDMDALEQRLREISFSKQNHFHYIFEAGDLLLLNNQTTLHGRSDFEGERELWRIQIIPPSMNSPWKKDLSTVTESESTS